MRRRFLIRAALAALPLFAAAGAVLVPGVARADAVEQLRAFVHDVKTGRAAFTQVVTSTDGAKRKTSSGEFEFMRPNRFRFEYRKPFEQLIVADGSKVWIYDADLNQVSSRRIGQALGSTPAALLAGGSLDADFDLGDQPDEGGLSWVLATPKAKDGPFKAMRIGFKGAVPVVVEIVDSFGQRSRLTFSGFESNPALDAARFEYHPPAGADVVEQ
ncbi:MAG: outer membrane lipoprotein chaperone LolA [Burkholderiales bacterium]|nr:outer membrane lipoprotein chaperone LolA [Burkholderiales bacterium]MDE1928163.1 outer membrane lipoprotein chaperone LolA [Burkholderiales bacterium]MDE2160810.1 outer membrane lipoprotein chaperone LolA [Burkholderiales bacterium]MDE2502124.1 outer membrane lipoprotein chaperone LolA [Burkholderiales bacterium]